MARSLWKRSKAAKKESSESRGMVNRISSALVLSRDPTGAQSVGFALPKARGMPQV